MANHFEKEKIEPPSLRDKLGSEFDQANKKLKNVLENHPDMYEMQKENYIKAKLLEFENNNLKTKLDAAEAFIEKRTEQLIQRSTDSVTGLRRREIMYETLNKEVEKLFGENLETLDNKELLKFLESLDPKELENTKFSVLMGDVSYLSLVNSVSHAEGDRFMRAMGDAARLMGSPEITAPEDEPMDAKFVASRYGGDEITAIVREVKTGAENVAEEFRLKVKESKIARECLKNFWSELEPNLDIGVAHITEGVEALRRFIRQTKVPKGERAKALIDFLIGIADRRSALQKGETRANLLIDLKSREPEHYRKIIDYLRKGAFEATDEEIDELAKVRTEMEKEGKGKNWRSYLLEFLRRKAEKSYEKEEEKRRLEREIIKSIAG